MMDSQASVPSEHKEKFMEISEQSFATANRRGKKAQAAFPGFLTQPNKAVPTVAIEEPWNLTSN